MDVETNQRLDWQPNSLLSQFKPVSDADFRYGMRHFASAVTIVAARDGTQRAGLTATAVCSVTAAPPRLVVFVNKNVLAAQVIINSGALSVNVLSCEQELIAKVFSGMIDNVRGVARFDYGHWYELVSGSPVLDKALVNFDCRVIRIYEESTHHVFLCEVLASRVCQDQDKNALVYFNGSFFCVPS